MTPTLFTAALFTLDLAAAGFAYTVDAFQRSVLFLNTLRLRGNQDLTHLNRGQPPVLVFDYETILDGRRFERPVNHALVRIVDRRRQTDSPSSDRRRATVLPETGVDGAGTKRPIVIIDPRAGHGPGIGGTKRDSEIGMALAAGHPVYFVIFFTRPEPGQTLADVRNAEIRFVEAVRAAHPDSGRPAVIGNCQGGWAAALIGASRPDLTGPMVFNGSPLSYWSGVDGTAPMRYRGGLCGGVWLASFWSDLGDGRFDGAHLVAGFEDLNPANTLWRKQYHLFANIDTEADRYLAFERWWGGYFFMTTEEIHFIVDSLFIGNKLEKGRLQLENENAIRLENMAGPILVFASRGDNITPPPQALNWIVRVFGSVENLRRSGRVVAYMVHDTIGHLGIFVSAAVARRQHREIIDCIDMLDYLAPGLYEMVIDTGRPDGGKRPGVRFEEREMADILTLDDGEADEADFRPVAAVSTTLDLAYRTWSRPWVRAVVTPFLAEWLRQLHPLRWSRYGWSDLNPGMPFLAPAAAAVRRYRRPAGAANVFRRAEATAADRVDIWLDYARDVRDHGQELLFKTLYGAPLLQLFFRRPAPVQPPPDSDQCRFEALTDGCFVEGVVRLILAMATAGGVVSRVEYDIARRVILANPRLRRVGRQRLKAIVHDQARLLAADRYRAIDTLGALITGADDRLAAAAIARSLLAADMNAAPAAKRSAFDRISQALSSHGQPCR